MNRYPFFVTCERGAEGALRREMVGLKIHSPKGAQGGVSFEADFAQAMKICVHARTAMRVLMQVNRFAAPNAEALYDGVKAVKWDDHISPGHTFAVRAQVSDNAALQHSGFAALKCKDAIVDHVRDATGARPNVDPRNPDVSVSLFVHGDDARLYLDLAGDPLHRRGYRVTMTEAPLKETLAAAVLALGDVAVDLPFVDPMAGSGTLAIEHAMRARQIAPGLNRRFGFERWPAHPLEDWRQVLATIKQEAAALALPKAPAPIVARDVDPDAVAAAQDNANAAGVGDDIRIEVGALSKLNPGPWREGTLCTNPPYGERVEQRPSNNMAFHRDLARTASLFFGWQLLTLAPAQGLGRALGLRPDFTHRLSNGGIDVQLQRYHLG